LYRPYVSESLYQNSSHVEDNNNFYQNPGSNRTQNFVESEPEGQLYQNSDVPTQEYQPSLYQNSEAEPTPPSYFQNGDSLYQNTELPPLPPKPLPTPVSNEAAPLYQNSSLQDSYETPPASLTSSSSSVPLPPPKALPPVPAAVRDFLYESKLIRIE